MPAFGRAFGTLADEGVRRARRLVASGVVAALGEQPGALAVYDAPAGDAGLFGPGSLCWQVHADLGAMLIGGYSALMLQSLHPLPMAGVAQHSRYREDPVGRLRATAHFVAGTTFGPTPLVDELIDKVREIHDHVTGTAPDGRAYSANDPALLTYVHVSEVSSFLRSYQRFGPRPLLRAEKDRYLAEVATIAYRLGATEVPTSVAAVRAYLAAIREELVLDADSTAALRFLREPIGLRPRDALAHRILADAATDLLPGFARRMLPRRLRPPVPAAARLSGAAFSVALRLGLGPSVVRARSLARVAAAPAAR